MDFNYRPTNRLMSPADIQAERQALQFGQQRNALQDMQMQQMRAAQAEQAQRNALMQQQGQRQNAMLQDMAGNMGPPQEFNPAAMMLAGFDPKQIEMLRGPQQKAPLIMGPGSVALDPVTRKPVFTAPFKQEPPKLPPLGELQAYRETLPQGDPRRREVDALIRNQTRAPAAASGPSPAQLAEVGGEDQLSLAKRFGKPAAGFRWKADGTMEPIPGGPADRRNTEAGIREQRSRDAAIAQADRVIGKVDQAMQSTGLLSAGPAARVLNLPGTPARDLQATLETIKANLGFAELQAMRDASPTGGALGAIAVQELTALQATVASLEQTQSPEQLRKSLGQIRGHYTRWKDVVNRARQEGATQGVGEEPPAPVRVNSDADFDALPSGATFIAPDGSIRRKP
jgi:hypothetical protein